ncbi:MAG TPA: ABC transporter permease [Acidobacteriaceae bacterium]|jgi:putative ABC transport system permease protein|nr:ABC transporter permease [Acidobacteriaceae bacterium]
MKAIRRLGARLRNSATRHSYDQRLREEMEEHLALQIAENLRSGLSPAEARRQAILKFGSLQAIREDHHAEGRLLFIETFVQDLRYALRMLARSPGFTLVAVVTLALGIGANAAIFSVVNAVLLRPLPYTDPGRLVVVPEARPSANIAGAGMSWPVFTELRAHSRAFSALAGLAAHALTLTGRGEPADISTVVVTGDFFSLFETKPLLGRVLAPGDGKQGAAPVVVLNENLWRSRFGADPGILGTPVTLDMRSFTVVGVMPSSFRTPFFTQTDQLWIPLVDDPLFSGWTTHPQETHWMPVLARLQPGISFAQARTEMATFSASLAIQFPEEHGWRLGIESLQSAIVGDARTPLLILLGAVGFVLLIACANMANLLLTRATARQKEIAVRIALGANARRIARQLLTESLLLSLLGGLAGLLLAAWAVSSLASLLPADLQQMRAIHVDGPVLAFALILSLIASLLFGLAPILFAAKSDPQAHLRESARAGETRGSQRVRSMLAVAEVALAVILLAGAGLLLRSFARLTSTGPGFVPDHVEKAMVSLPQFQYPKPQQWTAFSNDLLARLQAQPGLTDSAIAAPLPIADTFVNLPFTIVGAAPPPPGSANTAHFATVSPDYFSVMQIPMLRGRLFSADDSPATTPVALISEALARRYFPHQDPIGQQLTFGFPPNGHVSREIIGVVSDIHDASLSSAPGPMMYVPFAQAPLWGGEVVVRSTLAPADVAAAIRATTHSIDRNLPVTAIESLPQAVQASFAAPRFRTLLLASFSAIALLLAAIGIYGVIAFSVSRRTREIGTRMALGASPASILRLVIGESAKLVLLGLAIGIPAALLFTRYLSTLLFAVRPTDPPTFIAVAILLVLVALTAAWIPARRAMLLDPMVALRCE